MSFTLSSILPPGIDTNHLHDMVWQPKASLNNIQHREQEKRDTNSPLTKCKCHVSCFMTHTHTHTRQFCLIKWNAVAWLRWFVLSTKFQMVDLLTVEKSVLCSMWDHKKKRILYDVYKNSNIVSALSMHWL